MANGFTQQQIDDLKEAIANGVLMVGSGESRVQYRSLNEMRSILAMMEAELSPNTNPRRTVVKFNSGM